MVSSPWVHPLGLSPSAHTPSGRTPQIKPLLALHSSSCNLFQIYRSGHTRPRMHPSPRVTPLAMLSTITHPLWIHHLEVNPPWFNPSPLLRTSTHQSHSLSSPYGNPTSPLHITQSRSTPIPFPSTTDATHNSFDRKP